MNLRLSFFLSALLSAGFTHAAQPLVLSPGEAAKEGKALVTDILALRPKQNITSTGFLKIQDSTGKQKVLPVRFDGITGTKEWKSAYETLQNNEDARSRLIVIHTPGSGNVYRLKDHGKEKSLTGNETMVPFAGSDFWLADLGMEHLQWPEQRLLRKELRRGQSCSVLESINPQPAAGAYSRVVSWIDMDTLGVINADAYDTKGKLLKQFAAKSFKKVDGEWELKEIEISNSQTDSRTRIEFDLKSK